MVKKTKFRKSSLPRSLNILPWCKSFGTCLLFNCFAWWGCSRTWKLWKNNINSIGNSMFINLWDWNRTSIFLDLLENSSLLIYLMGPYNAGPNFTPVPLTPALITPVSKIPFPPFRAGVKRAARYIYWNHLFKSYAQRQAENNFRWVL